MLMIMSKEKMTTSPTRFNGELDHFFDPNFTEEISQKMQVPKRIKVNGENEDDVVIGVGGNQPVPAWETEKIDMQVPDRILVVGQEQLFGTRGTPLETSHENAVHQPETAFVRVQTPPRVITLSDHYFPSADDLPPMIDETPPNNVFVRPKGRALGIDAEGNDHRADINSLRMDSKNDITGTDRYRMQPVVPYREGTPSLTEGMTSNEEIAHLRRQLAKLNRRVMSIELENLQRQQCEKVVYIVGIAYLVWKTLLWLRSS